jgi:hypothetical protein
MVLADLHKAPKYQSVFYLIKHSAGRTHLVKSKAGSSPSLSSSSLSSFTSADLSGLSLRLLGAGLLLCGASPPSPRSGLTSNPSPPCAPLITLGVFPSSAKRQNGAGLDVGMCWLGRCAVLGGAKCGCLRTGAGVRNAVPSSWANDDDRTGDSAAFSPIPNGLLLPVRRLGNGLPSPGSSSRRGLGSFRRSGVC